MENISNNSHIPEEVIREILLRLPVKTLLRFKCVCKHWRTIIESQNFVNNHFGHESNHEHLLFRYDRRSKEGYAYALYIDESFSRYEEPDHLQLPDAISTLMGPLNGVFCAFDLAGSIALLNPATRQYRPLPLAEPWDRPDVFTQTNALGFGLDPLNGDYKVVWIQYLWNYSTCAWNHTADVSVYNSGSDSWKYFREVDLVNSNRSIYRSVCITYLNGVYYWLIRFDGTEKIAILAFDMSTDKFHEIQVPVCISDSKQKDLAVCGDFLALLMYDSNDLNGRWIQIWLMENDGSWTKSSKIGPHSHIGQPLGFWKNKELLFETANWNLARWDMSSHEFKFFEAPSKCSFLNWMFCYKESLFSLKGVEDKSILWDTSFDFFEYFFNADDDDHYFIEKCYGRTENKVDSKGWCPTPFCSRHVSIF